MTVSVTGTPGFVTVVGGFLIADSTLFGGAVAFPQDKTPNATAIRKFNELVFSEKMLDAAIIPLRTKDNPPYGFTVAYKNAARAKD